MDNGGFDLNEKEKAELRARKEKPAADSHRGSAHPKKKPAAGVEKKGYIPVDLADVGVGVGVGRNIKRGNSLGDNLRAQRQAQKDVGQLFDELVLDVGGYGVYQERMIFLVILPCFFMLAFVQCVVGFVVADPASYWCNIPELSDSALARFGVNMTEMDRQAIMPWDNSSNPAAPASCTMYAANYTSLLLENELSVKRMTDYLNSTAHNLTAVHCRNGYDFNMAHGDTSIVTEWDLVCDRSSLLTLANVLMVIATVLGMLVSGYVADRWGRKKPFFIFFLVMLVFGVSFAFAPSFEGFLALAVLHSFGSGPLYALLYTMAVEMLTSSSRLTMAVWLSIVYAIGAMLFALIAYFVQQWHFLTIYGTSPFILVFIYCFFLPESPRWLLISERFPEVEIYVRRIASVNGCPFNESCQVQLKQIFKQCTREVDIQESQSIDSFDGSHGKNSRTWCNRRGSWIWLFATPPMLRKTLLLTYLMCTLQICYYGLRAFTPPIAKSDAYFTSFISSVIEIPGIIFAWLICDRFGRRWSVMISFILSFLACVLTIAFQSDQQFFWGIVALFLIARSFISAAYVTGELLAYETFPTVIRMQGIAIIGAVAHLVSRLGHVIVYLKTHSDSLPLVVFGCLALVAVLSVFLLPETVCTALPETVEEADMRGTGLFRRAVQHRTHGIRVKKTGDSVQYHKGGAGSQREPERAAVVTVPANDGSRSDEPPTIPPPLNQPDGQRTTNHGTPQSVGEDGPHEGDAMEDQGDRGRDISPV
ncbi:Organic cation transporter 1 [Hypsibius exemplaris]|uniref:Organic cation transporter 1 n=1 Tax=Hypsibius exemplaris TaxID=2072580 RepID=A0A1W0XB34_HYPEX|nr:Organic cation transporter 1 [Hypsibius exemplaris]